MQIFLLLILLVSFTACGVKGPPLPPVADDPAASERENIETTAIPSPTPGKETKKSTQ